MRMENGMVARGADPGKAREGAPAARWRARVALALGALLAWPGVTTAAAADTPPDAPADIPRLQLRAAAISAGPVRAEGVAVALAWPAGAEGGELALRVARIDAPGLGQAWREVDWRCRLQRREDGGWDCAGALAARGARGPATLALTWPGDAPLPALGLARGRARIDLDAAADGAWQARLAEVPVAWLEAFARTLWDDARLTGGRVGGSVTLRQPDEGAVEVEARLGFEDLGLDTPDASIAAAGLALDAALEVRLAGAATALDAQLQLRGGELLVAPLYVELPAHPVEVALQARQDAAGGDWRLPSLGWSDPGALVLEGEATLGADAALRTLRLAARSPDLAQAAPRYLTSMLATAGLPGLVLQGGVSADVALGEAGLERLEARLDEVALVDPAARFGLVGLDGALAWAASGEAAGGELRWASGSLYGLGLGPATLPLASRDGVLRLTAPASASLLGGTLGLDVLEWSPPRGDAGTRIALGLSMRDMDLGRLAATLGWPPFEGTLSGRLPAARYADNRLDVDGAIEVALLGGRVALSRLAMERPFGTAPTLAADVAVEDIDLQAATSVFGFGEITGRLDGRVDGLRLLDWSPVAFDARFATDPAYRGPRRISQRAVRELSSVGGSGLVGGLQASVLRVFEDFGYARIGLGCRLRDDVCTMSGAGPADSADSAAAGDTGAPSGYVIVEGAGLPRITVVGFQQQVDWPVLLERLAGIADGQVPQFD